MSSEQDQANPPPLVYGCICSGISAPTLAAKHLGWKTAFFSEIEPFPRAVLKHRYPHIPLHGDFTSIQKDTYGTVDLLVGGTPCQSFSVAGKRLGLDDPRGNLALEYGALAIRLDALWLAFENVPGLLSSAKGEDFATFISAITGFEHRPPATGWQNAGIAGGRADRWGIAWRILDAQYFGVAQRRRRLFVIGYRGDWRPSAAVLLEPDSMRGDSPPSRKAQANVAALTATGVGTCGADDNQAQAGHLIPYNIIGSGQKGSSHAYESQVSGCLQHKGLAASGNEAGTLIAATDDISRCLNAGEMRRQDYESETFITHSLRGEGFDASEDGTGRGTPLIPVAYQCHGNNVGPMGTLRSGNGDLTGGVPFIAFSGKEHGIAVSLRGREGGATAELSGDIMPALRASKGGGDKPHVLLPSAVRRLTPEECETLQGMPRNFTRIAWRGKPPSACPDGNRYKAIGNSMAVPCVKWIFDRLDFVHHTLLRMEKAA